MCVLPQEMHCSNGKTHAGNSDKDILEGKNIETPNTAPDAAAIFNILHNSGNIYYQNLYTTSNISDATTELSTTSYVHSTNNQVILPERITHQVKFLNLFI
jgi:hypothetical protein